MYCQSTGQMCTTAGTAAAAAAAGAIIYLQVLLPQECSLALSKGQGVEHLASILCRHPVQNTGASSATRLLFLRRGCHAAVELQHVIDSVQAPQPHVRTVSVDAVHISVAGLGALSV
jgi:hypothetical protein